MNHFKHFVDSSVHKNYFSGLFRFSPSEKKEIEITDKYTEQVNFELSRQKILTRLVCEKTTKAPATTTTA